MLHEHVPSLKVVLSRCVRTTVERTIYEATVVATVEGWLRDDDHDHDERLADRLHRAIGLLLRGCAAPR